MRARNIKDDEIFWARQRARTGSVSVASLIGQSKVLEGVLIEKLAVPSLMGMSQFNNINNIM
jgi:hypothetical protein